MLSRGVTVLAILVLAAGCSQTERTKDGIATDEGIAAIALPESQFRDLLKRSFLGTQSGPMHLYALGLDEGCQVLEQAVESAANRYGAEWRANLIAAYRQSVPADKLAEAAGKSARRARVALGAYIPAIGAAMKQRSEPLLDKAGREVMQATASAAAKVDPSSVDLSDRQKELASAKAAGKICGVGRA